MLYRKFEIEGTMIVPDNVPEERLSDVLNIESEYSELDEKRKELNHRRDAWALQALADMVFKTAKTERDYVSAMRIALAQEQKSEDSKKATKIFRHVFAAYDKLCPLVNCAYVEYSEKGKNILKFVVERKLPHTTRSLTELAEAIYHADKISVDKPLARYLKQKSDLKFSLEFEQLLQLPSDQIRLATETEIQQAKENKAAKKAKKTNKSA